MARQNTQTYRRLPDGRLTRRYSLWQAHDHLLNVQHREFTERYTRFYLRDIQAILVQRTSISVVLAIIFGSLTALTALLAMTRESRGFAIFWWIMAVPFASVLIWNWFLGPTCICYLFTALDRYRIRALSRVRIAERVIDRLKPVIERAQRDLEIETPPQTTQMSGPASAPGMFLRPTATHVRPEPPTLVHYHGAMHLAVFVVLLVNALFLAGVLVMHGAVTVGGYALTLLALGVCTIIALVKQAGSDVPNSVKGITWGMLGYLGVSFVTGFAFLTAALYKYIRNVGEELVNPELTMVTVSTRFSPAEFPVFLGIYLALIAAAALSGGLGLIFLRRFRKES